MRLPEADPARWQEQIRELAFEIQRAHAKHRDIARLSLGNIPVGYHALRVGECMLSIMLAGGVPPSVAGLATDRLSLYIAADSYEGALIVSRYKLDSPERTSASTRTCRRSTSTTRRCRRNSFRPCGRTSTS